MSFFKDVSLRAAGSDLIGFMRNSSQHNALLFLAACIPTALIIGMFYLDSQSKGKPPPPTVTYFESWPASRTLEESKTWIAERQKKKDEARLREKEAYKAFGRAVGMDVDRIEQEAAAERAAKPAPADPAGAGK
jgi:hypothetical protein